MEYKKDLFKVVSGNSFSQLGEKKIGDPIWLGPWHLLQRKTSSKAHNVYYNKSELSTTCSITKDKGNWLNRLVKNIKLPRLYVIFSFITILLITMYCLPLLLKALEVYL